MSKKTTTVIKEEAVDSHDSNPVLAYRVGQLEKALTEGLREVKDELVSLRTHFATVEQLEAAKLLGEQKHKEYEDRIASLEDDRKWIQRSVGERLINWGATVAVAAYAFFHK